MNTKNLLLATALAATLGVSGQAMAFPSNVDEPTGPVLLDLNGTAIPHTFQHYTMTFSAVTGSTSTDLGFAFRDDPAFLVLDNVSLTANTGPATNLVVDGDFDAGFALVGWTFQNPNGALFNGNIKPNVGVGGTNAWNDGATQAYDTLFQSISTVGGASYTVSFDLRETSGFANFQRLSTNGDVTDDNGDGVNLVVYAGQTAPVLSGNSGGVPEPASWALMISGFGLAGTALRRRRVAVAA